MRSAISKNSDSDTLRKLQREKGHATLFQSGIRKVEQGVTSLEEVLSVAYE
jgi:type IV pilus assembly protein PilB